MTADKEDEMLDLVDERNRIVGRMPRGSFHGNPSLTIKFFEMAWLRLTVAAVSFGIGFLVKKLFDLEL
jgi:hypothetical protein